MLGTFKRDMMKSNILLDKNKQEGAISDQCQPMTRRERYI